MSDGLPFEERVRQTLARQAGTVQSLPPSWPPREELAGPLPLDLYRWSRPRGWRLLAATGVVISLLATLGGLALLGARNRPTANIRSAPALPSASTAHVDVTQTAQVGAEPPKIVQHYTVDVDFAAKRAYGVFDKKQIVDNELEAVQIGDTFYGRNHGGIIEIQKLEGFPSPPHYQIVIHRGDTPGPWALLPWAFPFPLVRTLDPEPRLSQLAVAQNVQNLGTDTIDGTPTTHYGFDCSCPSISADVTDTARASVAQHHELWMDSRGLLWQEVVTGNSQEPVTRSDSRDVTTIRYSRLGSPVDIRPPPPDELQPWNPTVITPTVVPGPNGSMIPNPLLPPGQVVGNPTVITGTLTVRS